MDDPEQAVNTITAGFLASLIATVDRLEAQRADVSGVVITSAKELFLAGRDLREIQWTTADEAATKPEFGRAYKTCLRRLETLGRPVVAAIGGTALGGGFELTLASHYRVALEDPSIQLGLPEVSLGLLPGGGGLARMVRMLGVTDALEEVLLPGTRFGPAQAQVLGLVDELADTPEDLLRAARQWIAANPAARQPWDSPDYRLPGGTPADPDCAARLSALAGDLRTRYNPVHYPAPHHILAAAVNGAQADFSTALEIERDHYIELVTGPAAKNQIQAFFDLRRVRGPGARPAGIAPFNPARAAILGAGMMGAGIAYICAQAGMTVVLTDTTLDLAQQGKERCARVAADAIAKGRLSAADGQRLLDRIRPTADVADARGAELLVEAVFEDSQVKAEALAKIEPHLADDALLASNTSALPITDLARSVSLPASFLGLHFFSPVHKMPLVEVIKSRHTDARALHRALDVARQLNKTAIVVNDSRGFFTSRVIRTFNDEGLRMLAEGIHPQSVEQACRSAGYPTPTLQLSDELNLQLMRRIRAAAGERAETSSAVSVIDRMLDEHGRAGRQAGAGFYDYEDGRRTRLWPGLADAFHAHRTDVPADDLTERLLFIEALEAARCLEEGVIESAAEANVGSLLGIGYPCWTGGVLQYINGYPGGPAGFLARAQALAATYGDRFRSPASLAARARRGESFTDDQTSQRRD